MSTAESKQNQRKEWQQRLTQWKASGTINAAEWCRKHEINIDHFYYWKSRLTNSPYANGLKKLARTIHD
jgi:hypothetical protein